MRFLRSRYFLPALMVPLFLIAFAKTDIRWRECTNDLGRVCFPYPTYLQYEVRQGLDIHWPALLPAILLDQLPDSIDPNAPKQGRAQWPRLLITISGLVGCWYCIGVWWQRLVSGHRISVGRKAARYGILCATGILATIAGLVIYLGVRGGFEGPTMTDAGCLLPVLLVVMALVECGAVDRYFTPQRLRLAIPLFLTLLYAWSNTALQAERSDYDSRNASVSCKELPGQICFNWPFMSSPLIQDGLALHWPPLLLASLPTLISSSHFPSQSLTMMGFHFFLVWTYWLTIISLAQRRWPATTGPYQAIRPWLVGCCAVILGFSLLAWLLGASQHGPTPALAVTLGMAGVICSLQLSAVSKSIDKEAMVEGDDTGKAGDGHMSV